MNNWACRSVAIIGSGALGTALAVAYGSNSSCIEKVLIYSRETHIVDSINLKSMNSKNFPLVKLPSKVRATASYSELEQTDLLVIAVPSTALRAVLTELSAGLCGAQPILLCAKGIEEGTLKLMTEVCAEVMDGRVVAVLSGPNFASEIVNSQLSATMIASKDAAIGSVIAKALTGSFMKAYYTDDIVGVQVLGAVKNVIAISIGMCMSLEFGENAIAAIITAGLKEATALSIAMGGKIETSLSLAGLGDLVLTCTSKTSRNTRLGALLGGGSSIDKILFDGVTFEGYFTSKSVQMLCSRLGLDLPIMSAVYNVLYEGCDVANEMQGIARRLFCDFS